MRVVLRDTADSNIAARRFSSIPLPRAGELRRL
jgi:hypothetical protein